MGFLDVVMGRRKLASPAERRRRGDPGASADLSRGLALTCLPPKLLFRRNRSAIGSHGERWSAAPNELDQAHDLATVFERRAGNRDLVPWLQGLRVPAKAE